MTKINLEELPDYLQQEILDLQKEPEPLFPIKPREHTNTHMQTKEFIEMTQIMDKLIEAVNQLYADTHNG